MQKVVTQMRAVREALDSGVEVAGIAAIVQSTHLKKKEPFTFKMDDARKICTEWEKPISRFKSTPNVEIEWRLGRVGSRFDTNVGKESFDKVMEGLRKYSGWEATKEFEQTVYYFENGARTTIDEKTDEEVTVIKKKLVQFDAPLANFPFDVRLSIATETPVERKEDDVASSVKNKHRWSFVRKNLSIDMTIMQGDPDDKDCDTDTTYHVEFEVIDPASIGDRDNLFNLIYKIFDLMKII
jgi:hypothetical protein